tara:strand:+ start:3485 stop:3754 length:270 start_codon:yes stop_codon:yes gene_type:complete
MKLTLATQIRNYQPGSVINVTAAGGSSTTPSYGTLVDLGYMEKSYSNPDRHDPDNRTIHWSTTDRASGITFKSSSAGEFTHPHTETWEK